MNSTTTATDTRDRYQRLTENIEILAEDKNLAAAEPPFDIKGLRAFVGSIVELRLLDGLSDKDADTVGLLSGVDFFQGPPGLSRRFTASSTTSGPIPVRRPITMSR
jgi:hypothetical protein